MRKSALIAGASGLVGRHCLELLLSSDAYERIVSIGRREIDIDDDDRLEQVQVNFERLEEDYAHLFEVDHIYCCLGTTINKAGSKAAFEKVDYSFPMAMAQLAKKYEVKSFGVITAMGANADSMIFYNKVKGNLENDLMALNLNSLNVLRPSLLLGEREESRFGESVGQKMFTVFSPLFKGPLKKYAAVRGDKVAEQLVKMVSAEKPGLNVVESDGIG